MKKLKALIIDDDPGISDMIQDMLSVIDHECDSVTSVAEARECLKNGTYNYVILDMEIPAQYGRSPMVRNGQSFLTEIRQKHNKEELPVIVITGRMVDKAEYASEMLWNDANDFITKPFPTTGHTLEASIRRYTAKKEQKTALAENPNSNEWLIYKINGSSVTWKTLARSEIIREYNLRQSTIQNRLLECIYEQYRKNHVISHFDIMPKCGWREKEYYKCENGKKTPTRGPLKNHVMKLRVKLGINAEFTDGGIVVHRPEK